MPRQVYVKLADAIDWLYNLARRSLKLTALLGLVALIAGILYSTTWVIMLFHDRIEQLKATQDRDYIKIQFFRIYAEFRDNFVDIALAAMDMDSTHQMLPLTDVMVSNGKRCAPYQTAMNGFFDATEYLGVSKPSLASRGFVYNEMDADIMSARIAIVAAIDNESITQPRTEAEIMGLLSRHDSLAAEENHLDYPKFSWALRGLFYLERAKKIAGRAQSDSADVKPWLRKAAEMYDSADASYQSELGNHRKHTRWSHTANSIASIMEYEYMLFDEDSVAFAMAEYFRQAIGYSGTIPEKSGSLDSVRTFANLAEILLMEDSVNAASSILESNASITWCEWAAQQVPSEPVGGQLRMSFESLMGLRVYCQINKRLQDKTPLSQEDVESMKKVCLDNKLFSSEYSGALTSVATGLIEAVHSSQTCDSLAQSKWEALSANILHNYATWIGPGGQSKPRVLLKKLCMKALTERERTPGSAID